MTDHDKRTLEQADESLRAFPATPRWTRDDIAQRAYAIWQARGGSPGHDIDDWEQAERELHQEAAAVGAALEPEPIAPTGTAEATGTAIVETMPARGEPEVPMPQPAKAALLPWQTAPALATAPAVVESSDPALDSDPEGIATS